LENLRINLSGTAKSLYTVLSKSLLIAISLLCLCIGCTSEAEKEFRKANGRIVIVDSTYHIPREYLEAKVLESGVYKIEFNEDYRKYIWFRSLLTDDIMLMDFTEYRNLVDNKIFHDATSADIERTNREKETGSKIIEATSIKFPDFVLVAGKEYEGNTIVKILDRHDPKAVYHPDQTINFKFDNKYYYVSTEKVTFTGPAMYKINFIKYKGLPWKQSDY